MVHHLFRSQAVAAAQKEGLKNFATRQDPKTKGWKYNFEPGESPAAEWFAAQQPEWVSHVETHWFTETPAVDAEKVKRGVVVVKITKEELAEILDQDDSLRQATSSFSFEPITPELWEDPRPTVTPPTRGAKTPANRGDTATEGDDAPKPQRAKSDAASPVEICRRIVPAMKDKPRAEVIAALVAEGVNKATASTQYSRIMKTLQ